MRFPASLLAFALFVPIAAAQPQHVAATDPKSPDDERKAFKLPPGFAAQLVAAEPDIQKPMQIAFDAQGRLWVTTSHHYPFPATDDAKASDKLFVLSDFAPDGRAKTVRVFADNLNIPIGVLPLPDCKSCIVSSAGRILKLTDADDDGKADRTEVLFTGFGFRDTHGMTNSYTLMPDGWVYACHGYLNESRVKGKDEHEVVMQSGHTFRFRPDGSRIEVYTRGQVNPFGMTVDPWGNLYTADCHSKPITQLMRGAYYQSFGKPHDGLGFAPHVTRHDHGSTALCGLAWYDADQFPKEYRGCMFLGNVVTNRINFDKIEWRGSTPVAVEQPDFLVSGDPWFRPTDIKLGPDGALYVSDFYNRIIGHYEVDLKHPGRDKDRGRVWRIVYTGAEGTAKPPTAPVKDISAATTLNLIALLAHPNLTVRTMATIEVARRGAASIEEGQSQLMGRGFTPNEERPWTSFLVWGPYRKQLDTDDVHLDVALSDANSFYRGQAYALAAVRSKPLNSDLRQLAYTHLVHEPDARARRRIVDALTAHPHPDNIAPLLALIPTIPAADTHLRYAARVALRNALDADASQDQLVWMLKGDIGSQEPRAKVLDSVFLGLPSAYAGWWLSERLKAGTIAPAVAEQAMTHVGRYGCDCHRAEAERVALAEADPKRMLARTHALRLGVQAAGAAFPVRRPTAAQVHDWLASDDEDLVRRCFDVAEPADAETARLVAEAARSPKRSEQLRLAALAALERGPREALTATCTALLRDPAAPPAVRDRALTVFASSPRRPDMLAARDMLKDAPYRQTVLIAVGLAGTPEGADLMFAAVKAGQASPRLLQEPFVLARLRAANVRDLDARVKELTAGVPSADARLLALVAQRANGFKAAKPDPAKGKALFTTNCANCHQVGGQGAKVGPNLDGIGNRGADRLCEDVLDPNRNVDAAFKTTFLTLADGRTLSGLLLRQEGKVLVLADSLGKEVRVGEGEVEKRSTSGLSPMPADWGEKLKPAEFYHLLAYLLDQQAK